MNKYIILGLYEYNDEYQVIDSLRNSVQFQGTKEKCKEYIEINK